MLRIVVVAAALLALVSSASAAGVWLYSNNGHAFGAHGGSPPTCSNELDFSVACNSQYLAMGVI